MKNQILEIHYRTLFFSFSGAGNRCCYDQNGNLMYTNDTKSGSRPGIFCNIVQSYFHIDISRNFVLDRFHFLGAPPYNQYGKVPVLSHYYHDIVPYYLCCEWSDMCDSYLYLRQTRDAKGYKEPRMGNDYMYIYRIFFLLLYSIKNYIFSCCIW